MWCICTEKSARRICRASVLYIDAHKLTSKKTVGIAAGHCMLMLLSTIQGKNVPVEFVKVHNNPNGSFQNGIPNLILHENQADSIQAE